LLVKDVLVSNGVSFTLRKLTLEGALAAKTTSYWLSSVRDAMRTLVRRWEMSGQFASANILRGSWCS